MTDFTKHHLTVAIDLLNMPVSLNDPLGTRDANIEMAIAHLRIGIEDLEVELAELKRKLWEYENMYRVGKHPTS